MSVLFEALQKAAYDYRAKKAPIILPLIKRQQRDTPFLKRVNLALLVAGVFVVGVLISVFVYLFTTDTPQPIQYIQVPVSTYQKEKQEVSTGIVLKESVPSVFDEKEKVHGEPKPSRTSLVITHEKNKFVTTFDKAEIATQLGEYKKAITLYNHLLLEQPQNAQIYAALGEAYTKQNKLELALRSWQKAYQIKPRNTDYILGLAVLYDRLGKINEAVHFYKRIPAPRSMETQRRLDYLRAQLRAIQSLEIE